MSKVNLRGLAVVLFCLIICACSGGKPEPGTDVATAPPPPQPCPASSTWVTSPNPPTEIGGGVPVGQETNCQFYQFAYQWFFSMVQPSGASGERQFETLNLYQPGRTNQCALPKMTGRANIQNAIFVRTKKTDSDTFDPVLPEDIKQATGQALYDQGGNVVLFSVFYNPTECQATSAGFLPNTIEIKTAWRILGAADPGYYTLTATIPSISPQPLTLGLAGFHLVINTRNHPEFVWASFEHVNNAPDCSNPQPAPAGGWSFLSASCAACLQQNGINGCPQCKFNTGVKSDSIKGTPNEVCRVYSDGTDPGSTTNGNNNDVNRFNIDTLNSQLGTILSQLPANSPMAVWKNYKLVGGLWTNGGVGSSVPNEQRGSLEAANMTMETFFQQPDQNCFTCHGYDPAQPLTVSHIAGKLLPPSVTGKQSSKK